MSEGQPVTKIEPKLEGTIPTRYALGSGAMGVVLTGFLTSPILGTEKAFNASVGVGSLVAGTTLGINSNVTAGEYEGKGKRIKGLLKRVQGYLELAGGWGAAGGMAGNILNGQDGILLGMMAGATLAYFNDMVFLSMTISRKTPRQPAVK